MKAITIRVPERLAAELEAAARREGVSKCDIVRDALEKRLARKRPRKSLRVHDLAKDLAGSVQGPADLLTNPNHGENYGA
ncbi:MAG TPA: ribbon-helix-helix protein, CopG family [Tepidisphaeraceae bacterium]|nr:ribbon-helix-helix protein, CopG family [Tepidisphaeraceae bacterium]